MVAQAPAAARRGAGSMREREHGSSSITALRSIYYMVKVLLAVFVGCSGGTRDPGRRRMIAGHDPAQGLDRGALASVLLLVVVFELIRSRRLRERYALLWLLTAVVLLVLSVWRGGLNTIAGWVGVALPAGRALRRRVALRARRAAALLDGDLAALRPERDPRPARSRCSRAQRGSTPEPVRSSAGSRGTSNPSDATSRAAAGIAAASGAKTPSPYVSSAPLRMKKP